MVCPIEKEHEYLFPFFLTHITNMSKYLKLKNFANGKVQAKFILNPILYDAPEKIIFTINTVE